MTTASKILEDLDLMHSAVLVEGRTHSLGKAKVNEAKADKSHQFVKSAIDRIKTGMKYGDDMKSSAKVAYKDAVSLLQKAIKELKESAFEEAKTPSAAVSKAMNDLIVELRQFYMFDEIGKANIRDFKKFEDSIVKFAKKYNL